MVKLKVGVAGVGHLGKVHTKLWKEVEGAELCGVFDENRAVASAVANEFHTENFEDYTRFLHAIDALSIVTTTQAHYAVAKQAILAGKHVLIEKPITTTTEQAEELIELAKQKE